MAEVPDISIIYYTANKISQGFYENTSKQLLKAAGDIPIISVSQKPIDLGTNICVGDIGQSYLNIYRQALIGAKAATTPYIVMAEDDALYSPDHFKLRPSSMDVFAYNLNSLSVYTWKPLFSYKDRRVLCMMIAPRELFIEAMEERFAKYPRDEDINLSNWSEPGKYEKYLGVTVRKTEKIYSETPNIVFSHPEAFAFSGLGTRKRIGNRPKTIDPYWGSAEEIIKLYVRP